MRMIHTVLVTPVLGAETSKSVLMSKDGLLVQHCLLVAVLHVCLGTSWCASGGAARTAVLKSKLHSNMLLGSSSVLDVRSMLKVQGKSEERCWNTSISPFHQGSEPVPS